jgi:hypothetical protein
MLNKEEWKKAKEAEAIQPAGQLCPTPKPYTDDPNAKPVTIIPRAEWSDGMKNIVAYSEFLGRELMDVQVTVRIVDTANNFIACYGPGQLDFNLRFLGRNWFEQGPTETVDCLTVVNRQSHARRLRL